MRYSKYGSVAMMALALLASLPLIASAQTPPSEGRASASGSDQKPKFVSLTIGETTRVQGATDTFERVLFPAPEGEKLSAGAVWEFSPELAIKLGRLKDEKQKVDRWRAIRRNLGLSPDDKTDWIRWKEVIDAIFDQIGNIQLPAAEREGEHPFGLRVSFSGNDAAGSVKALAELTFNSDQITVLGSRTRKVDFESALKGEIAAALTGVDGFVSYFDGATGKPIPAARAGELFARTKIRLVRETADQGEEVVPDAHGYYRLSPLPVDREFGSDYQLEIITVDGKPAAAGAREAVDDIKLSLAESGKRYVPVRYGARTRLDLNVRKDIARPDARGAGYTLPGAPASISMMFSSFVQGNVLLGMLMDRLPPNPGLHFGAVQIKDAGVQPLWSVRFRFQEAGLDRSPRFVSTGTFRLQALASQEAEGTGRQYYLKISWFAQAEAAELNLQSRETVESPWGLGVGVVPSVSPTLYTAGISYKLLSPIELFVGAGIQKSAVKSVVYGVTLDVDDFVDMIFGKSAKSDVAQGADAGSRTASATAATETTSAKAPQKTAANAPPAKK